MPKAKKLIVDGQIFQTDAKDRGMGRYSVALIQSLLKFTEEYQSVEILLSNNLPTTDKEKDELQNMFNGATLKYIDLHITLNNKIEHAIFHNEALLNNYVADSGGEVDFLIASLFQEPMVSVFPKNVKKLLIFYDLIPYLYHKRYESLMPFDNYLKRFRFIFDADQIFTISQTVSDDLHTFLGVPKDRLVRIDGAAIRAEKQPEPAQLPEPLPDKFVLMPTSDDPRKNNLNAVLGFEEFLATESNFDYKLVITSKIKAGEREHIEQFSSNLIFTGNLPEEQLDWLYQKCDAVLFAPEYEGLGLPILEAVESSKSIACSSISVFKEISEDAFSYCDHLDPSSIARAIKKALTTKPNQVAYQEIKNYYTWEKTIERFMDGTRTYHLKPAKEKIKIAIFTPTPDGYSAIGKVVAESHAVMSEHFEIDYFSEKGVVDAATRPNFLQYVAPMHSAQIFGVKNYKQYQAVIYHLGNGDYHLESIKNALYLPGYAIFHDTDVKEAFRILGETNLMPAERIELEQKLNNTEDVTSPKFLTSIANRQLGILTHSNYASAAAGKILDSPVPVQKANLPTATASLPAVKQEDKIVIGLAGIIADIKGLEVIESIAKDPSFANCSIKIFGFSYAPQTTIDRLNSYENIAVTTSLTDFEFQANLSRLNVFVNYRMGYNGETSLSTIEAMRLNVAVIVRNIGWYGELPDDSVVKANSVEDAIDQLRELIQNPDKLNEVGIKAKKYIAQNFSHEQYALSLANLINQSEQMKDFNHHLAKKIRSGKIKTKGQYLNFLKANQ